MMLDFPRRRRHLPLIELVPLIDVAFLIIMFFLLVSTFEPTDIVPVDLPAAQSGKALEEGPVTVVFGRRGEVVLGDALIEPEELGALLAERLKGEPQKLVSLKVDAKAPARVLLQAMQTIREAGGVNISLATQQP